MSTEGSSVLLSLAAKLQKEKASGVVTITVDELQWKPDDEQLASKTIAASAITGLSSVVVMHPPKTLHRTTTSEGETTASIGLHHWSRRL